MQQVLYYGGPILTLEQPLYAEALLQQGGIIRAVGPLEKLKAMAPDAKRVNLAGRALLPAFLDAHSHFPAMPMRCFRCGWRAHKVTRISAGVLSSSFAKMQFRQGSG